MSAKVIKICDHVRVVPEHKNRYSGKGHERP
jgi:hypothetical protein